MAFEALPDTVDERYFRGDSACYETDLLQWLSAEDRHSAHGAVQEVPVADGARGRPDESRRVRDAVTAVRQRTDDRADPRGVGSVWAGQASQLQPPLAARRIAPPGRSACPASTPAGCHFATAALRFEAVLSEMLPCGLRCCLCLGWFGQIASPVAARARRHPSLNPHTRLPLRLVTSLPQPANPELRALGEDLGLTYTASRTLPFTTTSE